MDKVILAKDVFLDGGLGSSRPNDNQIVFGGTGSGKTFSTVLPTLCHMQDSSIIATFAKGGIVSKVVSYYKELGYTTYIWNLANPQSGDGLPDPLSYVNSDDDAQELAKQIANSNPQYNRASNFDPYWREASESLLTGLMYYVLMTSESPCMKEVVDLFYKMRITETGRGISTTIDGIIDELQNRAPESIAARKLKSFAQLPYATAGCVRDDLEKAIQCVFPTSIQNAMSDNASVSFKDFAKERTAIFIITSPVRTAQYAFANLMFSIAIRQLMEYAEKCAGNRLPRDVKLIFDDFSCGFPIMNYEKSISTFRAAGLSSMMLCQSLSQLDATYGHDNATVILDNCAALAYLPGGLNQQTATYVANMLDLPMHDVLFMKMGKIVVFQSGQKPIIAPRYDILNDPLYQKLMSYGKERDSLKSA